MRWYHKGDPGPANIPKRYDNPVEGFWARVIRRPDGCWEWGGGRQPKGYGTMHVGAKTVLAHRFAYELLVGPVPEGLQLDHLCRNRPCVNPEHLEPVTQSVNQRRGLAAVEGTHCRKGHPYSERNSAGYQICRICQAANRRRRNEERDAAQH